MGFASIPEAIEDLRAGKMLILLDDEDRENEGDLIMAAECVTPEDVNFITKHARGLLCCPLSPERADELGLEFMSPRNTALHGTAFTVSVDAVHGTTTGISAHDRAVTIRALADPKTKPEDLARPGHIFPLRAVPGGVLRRAGHTEAVVDLLKLAGMRPVGVLCEILNEDGSMARAPELLEMAQRFGIKAITIADLIKYRRRTEKLVHRVATTRLPTRYGEFTAHAYASEVDDRPYIALVKGELSPDEPCLVRIHSGCLTGDVFHSLKCDCGAQLELAFQKICEEGRGVVLYIPHHEGRGIGLLNKLKAYELQDHGFDTVEANRQLGFKPDLRDYGLGCQVLVDLGLCKVRLMTNNPAKRVGIESYGLQVVERVPLRAGDNKENLRYLITKKEKLGHLLDDLPGSGNGTDQHSAQTKVESEELS
ncbi:MAG: bifunctional 3,4-dihydroxy-2-butanone-4-phosphate synthase/GTP cyclohydrolase II [Armatimonadota bacterium]